MINEEIEKRQEEVEEAGLVIQNAVNEHFGQIADPRRVKSTSYRLTDIIFYHPLRSSLRC